MAGKRSSITHFVLSHKGLVRANNEDCAAVKEMRNFGRKRALLAILADGVGGHKAGEIASRIAVDTIIEKVRQARSLGPQPALEKAILRANEAILEDVGQHPDHKGMGTTCVCALISGKKLYAAHLGDSRMYLLREGSLSRLTRDHTMFEEYKHLTIIHPDKSRSHPLAHVLSRYLGSTREVIVDTEMIGIGEGADALELQSGDILLLCSDGLTDMLSDEEIMRILQTCDGRKGAQGLVMRALEKGGHDNTTVITLKIR